MILLAIICIIVIKIELYVVVRVVGDCCDG